jgi:lysophospholipase L1-like esterase
MILFGDSFMSNCDSSADPNFFAQSFGGPGSWINYFSAYRTTRLPLTNNFGLSGDVLSNMVARVGSVLAAAPQIVVLEGGTNDILTNSTFAAITANLAILYNSFLQAGCIVIRPTIIPRPGTNPATGFSPAMNVLAQQVNAWDRANAASFGPNFYLVDLDPLLVQAGWTIPAYYLKTDGVHPSAQGSAIYARAVAAIINNLLPDIRSRVVTDTFDPITTPKGNLLPNAQCLGAAGNDNGGGGQVANSSQVVRTALGGATLVSSVGFFADGTPAQICTLSGTYSGATNLKFDFLQTVVAGQLSNIAVGDTLVGTLRAEIGANVNIAGLGMFMQIIENGTTRFFFGNNADLLGAIDGNGYSTDIPFYMTPSRQVGFVPTQVFINLRVWFVNTGVAGSPISGTVKVGNLAIRKV